MKDIKLSLLDSLFADYNDKGNNFNLEQLVFIKKEIKNSSERLKKKRYCPHCAHNGEQHKEFYPCFYVIKEVDVVKELK